VNTAEFVSMAKDPDRFYEKVPKEKVKNVQFRLALHSYLAENKEAQTLYLYNLAVKPELAFASCLWTYNPFPGLKTPHQPFIPWPQQEIAIREFKDAIDNGHDLVVDKTRREGATELLCKMFLLYWLLEPNVYFLVGSRKEELVDQSTDIKHGRVLGSHQTLFHKILYGIANLPVWWQVKFSKRHRFLQNELNGSMIEGEATSESFGAGNRARAALVDECARIEPEVAQYIIDNIHDTTPCCIYNSTHFRWGAGHPYAKLLRSNRIKVITLGYETNPEKSVGLYTSPTNGYVTIKDMDYYRQKCPEIFTAVEPNQPFSIDWLEGRTLESHEDVQAKMSDIRFVADGGEGNFGRDRSVWYDHEELDRARSKMDLAQNILRVPQGSADMFFDNGMLERIRSKYAKAPKRTGDIQWEYTSDGTVVAEHWQQHSKGRLAWWGDLQNDRPVRGHNYVVACDISYGKGASNSVAAVCDVNNQEVVGLFVDPFININDFADYSVALSKWCGGAFLIWESNGPGNEFDHRVRKQRYAKVYISKPERRRVRKFENRRGWQSTPGINGSKIDMLNRLDAALVESVREEPLSTYLIVHDDATIRELEDYIFDNHKIDVNPANMTIETSGAKYAHGDRVIAIGMCVLAMELCPKGVLSNIEKPPRESFEYRFREWQDSKTKAKPKLTRVFRY
jgi:hypothetical protein